jgi:hypothetical protein
MLVWRLAAGAQKKNCLEGWSCSVAWRGFMAI